MAIDPSNDSDLVPQIQIAIISTSYQRVLDEADCQEAHIDVLKVIVLDALIGKLVLRILVGDEGHAELCWVYLIVLIGAGTHVRVSLWYSKLADLVL